ncbi:Uncharacterized protein TCM_045599 [Theobroma cacao]|uniref:Uncharacterized protein n=1 Tax=Theobroma cacao TaxID=3641 RepID=A0A061FTD6_THECC|nr:Uncharacterized protein TCM_045599 [Theobroma cacao]
MPHLTHVSLIFGPASCHIIICTLNSCVSSPSSFIMQRVSLLLFIISAVHEPNITYIYIHTSPPVSHWTLVKIPCT